MYIAILGRQPELGIAELESVYKNVSWFSKDSALIDSTTVNLDQLGGSQKIGEVILRLPAQNWSQLSPQIVDHFLKDFASQTGKITLGISAYGFTKLDASAVQKTGLILKNKLKSKGRALRLVPNGDSAALSSASSHHNKLGLSDNKLELLVVNSGKNVVVAKSVGAQNISAYAARDQQRPKRDAFVGMLPPKLAQIMINLAVGNPSNQPSLTVLDPFCGTGVILQEAALMNYAVYGSDLAPKMIDYSQQNMAWLAAKKHLTPALRLEVGDATTHTWQPPINAIVSETYLGQPFSAPPSPAKLTQVRGNCNHILSSFLKNLGPQIKSGTALCLAVPAWQTKAGELAHLPLIKNLEDFGFKPRDFSNIKASQLIYFRPNQVVARQLLVMNKV